MGFIKATSRLGVALAVASPATAVMGGTITGWNTGNVLVGPPVAGDAAAASVVYDRALPDVEAQSNGQIAYQAPEADTPGLRVSGDAYATGQGAFDGCVLASGSAECDSGFQSGKRFKQQFTKAGPIDLVFDVSSLGGPSLYQVFHRATNLTGQTLRGISLELGFGLGSDFRRSTGGDGLAFSQSVGLGPNNLPAFTQFPFGLFGDDAQPNPNPEFTLDGFFDGTGRAGFDLLVGPDLLSSTGFYGGYDDLFGNWLSREMAPEGLFWDWAAGLADPLLMAWDNGGAWEVRRGIDDTLDGMLGTITVNDVFALDEMDWQTFAYSDISGVQDFLDGIPLFDGQIEDLANLNVNYAIELGDDLAFDTFTLRTVVTPVPVPLTAPMLVAALGLLGLYRRPSR